MQTSKNANKSSSRRGAQISAQFTQTTFRCVDITSMHPTPSALVFFHRQQRQKKRVFAYQHANKIACLHLAVRSRSVCMLSLMPQYHDEMRRRFLSHRRSDNCSIFAPDKIRKFYPKQCGRKILRKITNKSPILRHFLEIEK